MARVKRGVTSHAKHKKVLRLNKGYRMTKNRLIKVAKEAMLHAGEYSYAGRRLKKRDMRRMWVSRINQSVQKMDLSYSRFINALRKADIQIDRKILANLVVENPDTFDQILTNVRSVN